MLDSHRNRVRHVSGVFRPQVVQTSKLKRFIASS